MPLCHAADTPAATLSPPLPTPLFGKTSRRRRVAAHRPLACCHHCPLPPAAAAFYLLPLAVRCSDSHVAAMRRNPSELTCPRSTPRPKPQPLPSPPPPPRAQPAAACSAHAQALQLPASSLATPPSKPEAPPSRPAPRRPCRLLPPRAGAALLTNAAHVRHLTSRAAVRGPRPRSMLARRGAAWWHRVAAAWPRGRATCLASRTSRGLQELAICRSRGSHGTRSIRRASRPSPRTC